MTTFTFHWRHRHHKLGDTIMMLSAMQDYAQPWPIIDKDIGQYWKPLCHIFNVKPEIYLTAGPRIKYHANKVFPILKPCFEIPKNNYIVTLKQGAKDWTAVNEIPKELIADRKVIELDKLKISLKSLFHIIGGAEEYIGIDSGPMWIAESCRIPKKVLLTPSKCSNQLANHTLLTEVKFIK